MKVKVLFDDRFRVLATTDGEECPAETFLLVGEGSYLASRTGLLAMLETVAQVGLSAVPPKWFHEANKQQRIYEFRKGDLRLFFFKGERRDIVVCTSGVVKKGRKADSSSVAHAAAQRNMYLTAAQSGILESIFDGQDD